MCNTTHSLPSLLYHKYINKRGPVLEICNHFTITSYEVCIKCPEKIRLKIEITMYKYYCGQTMIGYGTLKMTNTFSLFGMNYKLLDKLCWIYQAHFWMLAKWLYTGSKRLYLHSTRDVLPPSQIHYSIHLQSGNLQSSKERQTPKKVRFFLRRV